MTVLKYRNVKRRDLLSWMGGAALALPFLELFEGNARAQGVVKKSKYAVFCYTPDGVNQSVFWPTGTETNFQLSSILAPFTPFKDKMLLLGPQMNGTAPRAGTGLAYAGPTPQHQAPVCLTGRVGTGCGKVGVFCAADPNFGLPYTADQTKADNRINGPSIDQVIATAVQGESLFSSLNFGMHPIGGDTPSDLNYAMDGTPLKRMASADEAWTRMFGTAMGMGPDGAATQAAADLRMHNAVSDFLHARTTSLRKIISVADRRTLDGHLSALRTYEDRKARLLTSKQTQTVGCAQPPGKGMVPTDPDSVRTGADTQLMSPFFMDMIATAFTCGMTKVASVTFGYPGGGDAGGLRMPWLGFSEALHAISHHGNNPVNMDKYSKMNNWVAGQVAGLMQKLAAVPTGTGTLLDDTTIYWFNRHGDGNPHSNFALPNIILGGTGGYFKMGRWLQLPATSPTKVLISIANAMGVDVPAFGEKALADTTALSGIAA